MTLFKFMKNSFNALVGAIVSTASAVIGIGPAIVAVPVVAGVLVGLDQHSTIRKMIFGPLASLVSIPLAVIGGGLLLAASPFLGIVRGFRNGLRAALIPSVIYYTCCDRSRERWRLQNQERLAEIRRQQVVVEVQMPNDFSPLPLRPMELQSPSRILQALAAGAALGGRYLNEPRIANDELIAKISRLQMSLDKCFPFLSVKEVERIKGLGSDNRVGQLYQNYLVEIRKFEFCAISMLTLDDISELLTIEFKEHDQWHFRHFDASAYLLYIGSKQANQFADLPENRTVVDGRTLEFGEGNGSLINDHLTLYKGLHASVVRRLHEALDPILYELRKLLDQELKPIPISPEAEASPRARLALG